LSEFETLIQRDFSQITKAQFAKLLKLIMSETGPQKDVYLRLVQLKVSAYMVELLIKIEANTRS